MITIPRTGRALSESKIYHVMIRGNDRKPLFIDDADKAKFLDILYLKSSDRKWLIYAYCLMDNHVHLLINEGSDSIARIMKRIGVSYTYYFNKKYNRIGHLLQDRFKSEVIDTDRYLLSAARYIHNNPVKAGLSIRPEEYLWSSYTLYTGNSKSNINIIEYKEDTYENISIKTYNEAEEFVQSFIKGNLESLEGLELKENKMLRNTLIHELKKKSHLSIREMAQILNLNRNIIQRT